MESFKLFLFFLLIIYCLFSVWFYKRQNTEAEMGGSISKAKMVWLGLVTFTYFILVIIIWLQIGDDPAVRKIIQLYSGLILFRLFTQGLLMFIVKKWYPIYGIVFNVVMVVILVLYFFVDSDQWSIEYFTRNKVEYLYLGLVSLFALTDTYYAYAFNKVLKGKTTGETAIWYVSENNVDLSCINKLTIKLNSFYLLLFIIELIAILKK